MTILVQLVEHEMKKKVPAAYKPSYNIAPSQDIIAQVGAELTMVKWGYKKGNFKPVINAQLENREKPFWKSAKRCVILADGFYEWKQSGTKTPYRITPNKLFAFAALYDEETNTAAILTTKPNATMQKIHHRMPVMLHIADIDSWIDEGKLKEIPEEELTIYPVSNAVNNPRNNGAQLIVAV